MQPRWTVAPGEREVGGCSAIWAHDGGTASMQELLYIYWYLSSLNCSLHLFTSSSEQKLCRGIDWCHVVNVYDMS